MHRMRESRTRPRVMSETMGAQVSGAQNDHRPAIRMATQASQEPAGSDLNRESARKPNQQQERRQARQSACIARGAGLVLATLALHQLLHFDSTRGNVAEAVSVQRLQVPDLLVIDQQQQQQRPTGQPARFSGASYQATAGATNPARLQGGPEAASLINGPGAQLADSAGAHAQVVTFECLISFDRKRDRNLIVKWHHDERNEPIYQWIPELNKRTVAPPYRAFIAPLLESSHANLSSFSSSPPSAISTNASASANQAVQLLEAGFRLVRPTKELGGRYTCSAISSQNDDSKSKKMIVYTPPRSFRFNASRADIGALLVSQRDRLIQLTQPAAALPFTQLPLAYRTRGLDPSQAAQVQHLTTISPQMYSTIDYVNVNQQRASRVAPAVAQSTWPPGGLAHSQQQQQQQQVMGRATSKPRHGIKLVCDIDQVFPVPEVSIYRLARLEGAQAERLAKLDTKIERDPFTGLFRVQVTSVLDDDELANIRQNYLSAPLVSAPPELEIQLECVIALTNLELGKYADNRRSIIYRPGQQLAQGTQWDGSSASTNLASRTSQLAQFGSSHSGKLAPLPLALCLLVCAALALTATRPR